MAQNRPSLGAQYGAMQTDLTMVEEEEQNNQVINASYEDESNSFTQTKSPEKASK